MDKFFIQNAFKTLDEVEEEMKKSSLTEDVHSEIPAAFDLDELQDKYVGLGCVIKDPENQYVDDCGSIQGLVDFNGDFEKSVWKVVLDTGISLNVSGSQLAVDLEEKLPKDLARAYNAVRSTNGLKRKYDNSDYFPKAMTRGRVTIDFENSNYIKITPEEAIDNYFSKKDRYKLRCLLSRPVGAPIVVMWDKDGNLLNLKGGVEPYIQGSITNFKDIVRSADTIYVTDEDEHKIQRNGASVDPGRAELRDLATAAGEMAWKNRDLRTPKLVDNVKHAINWEMSDKAEKDTGRHLQPSRLVREIQFAERLYRQRLQRYGKGSTEVDLALRRLKELRNDRGHEKDIIAYSTALPFSATVARFILLKYLANGYADEYEKLDNASPAGDHEYVRLMNQLNELNAKAKEIAARIADVQNKLNNPELKKDYEDQISGQLDHYGEEYSKCVDALNAIRKEHGLKVEESFNPDECISHLRIYTVDANDHEDFIDDAFDSEEGVLEKAKELVNDDYKKVCVIRVTACPEDQEDIVDIIYDSDEDLTEAVEKKPTFGELIDNIIAHQDNKETSLKESKSFNIKDEKEVADALAYKGVGEEQDEELVVVDPSIESMDEEHEPHEGDAILQCIACKTSIFTPTEKLEKDGGSDIYNKETACPHCGAKDGFKYLYQVSKKEDANQPEEAQIDAEDNVELTPVEDDFVEVDEADNVKEESFERLINPYLTKLYENIESFKTTSISQPSRNTLKIEGKLIGKNGNEKLVEFLFTKKENKNKTLVLEGYNPLLTDDQKAYTLTAKLDNKELVFESFSYNYNKEIDGENILIEGIEK